MNIARHPSELEPARRSAAVGTFDGVHLGHLHVLDEAREAGLRLAVVTFDPHPRNVVGDGVRLLTSTERRLELLAAHGVEDVLLLRFDDELAALTPEEFAEDVLRAAGIEVVAAGESFRFGRGRTGDLALLERLGFDVRRVPLVGSVSSSRIRDLLAAGAVGRAAGLLGRPAEVEGIVVRGDGRGRELGFPTANLDTPDGLLVPADGVYAGHVLGHRAAISIGTNPTYGGVEQRVEAHLLDFDGDLYGQRLVVELWELLRGQVRFSSQEELVDAIAADVEHARAVEPPR
ncbi:MAG: riboflavin biosynthesis protein RibF, partial [Actinobacteria bacterium]|nr:riboflavin biosynthesis protein RibF [Actinomycetota bacterium]